MVTDISKITLENIDDYQNSPLKQIKQEKKWKSIQQRREYQREYHKKYRDKLKELKENK